MVGFLSSYAYTKCAFSVAEKLKRVQLWSWPLRYCTVTHFGSRVEEWSVYQSKQGISCGNDSGEKKQNSAIGKESLLTIRLRKLITWFQEKTHYTSKIRRGGLFSLLFEGGWNRFCQFMIYAIFLFETSLYRMPGPTRYGKWFNIRYTNQRIFILEWKICTFQIKTAQSTT